MSDETPWTLACILVLVKLLRDQSHSEFNFLNNAATPTSFSDVDGAPL